MTTKAALISEILLEIRKAQTESWTPPPDGPIKRMIFPPLLSVGDGRNLAATEELLRAVVSYARIYWENDPALKPRFKIDELNRLAERSFANALIELDFDLSDDELHPILSDRVAELLSEQIEHYDRSVDLVVGCHLFEGDEPFPLQIGPVLFETREGWWRRMLAAEKLSTTTARRLHASWSGKALKKRKVSFDAMAERSILDAVGNCPIICSVATEGLAEKYIQEKGLLAARLAMTAISLTWLRPAEGLRRMNLLYDRRNSLRITAVFGSGKRAGMNSDLPDTLFGHHVDAELLEHLRNYRARFDQFGEAIYGYVQPNRTILRPAMMNALFLSLWWYHEACREPLDQIATTKFAASMDAFTNSGKARGIENLIAVRLGCKPKDVFMKDGRTTKKVVDQIYNSGRSKLIHGSSDDFAHDWTDTRGSAEVVGRLLLIHCCDWILQNRQTDNLKDLSCA